MRALVCRAIWSCGITVNTTSISQDASLSLPTSMRASERLKDAFVFFGFSDKAAVASPYASLHCSNLMHAKALLEYKMDNCTCASSMNCSD